VNCLKTYYNKDIRFYRLVLKILITALLTAALYSASFAQVCPPNIDFESGTFDGWECYTGSVSAETGSNVITLQEEPGPVIGRHTMYSSFPGDGIDEYGGFPINCPNGSGHSIKLGNNIGGGQAEGMSYTFVIPATANVYNLIYNYAVVFQDPAHLPYEQPRMEIEITNVTDQEIISCSSFTFFPNGSPLPGFELSTNPNNDTPVWFKRWSAVSINLDGNAGKTIRLLFKTADCTFRRHFGYAYIDVNSQCSGSFIGASFCPDDAQVVLTAPYGYQNYTWYNSTYTQTLGSTQTLTVTPPPASGTVYAVAIVPYDGYGCPDTLLTSVKDDLVVTADAGRDTVACNHNAVQIGVPPRPELSYHWEPSNGLSDPDISNPAANPDVTTKYIVTTKSRGGGCMHKDTVVIKVSELDNSIELVGNSPYCTGTPNPPVLKVHNAASIQWFKDGISISGANQTQFNPTESGVYHALMSNIDGCILNTASRVIFISSVPVPGFTIDDPDQCLLGNKFVFTNTSTNALGDMQYKWILGDGSTATTRDLVYSYTKSGTYKVKMIASSNTICADSSELTVHVYQNPTPSFIVNPVCINMPSQIINNTADTVGSTINYLWTFDDGEQSVLRDPPSQTYSQAAIHPVTLSVSSVQCPSPLITSTGYLIVENPKDAIRYPEKIAVVNLPLQLEARQFGVSALWTPAVNLDNPVSYTPVFNGTTEQLYTIEIKSQGGCVTVDTQMVKTAKSIQVYVPAAFTPDNDGVNDLLRPMIIGIKQVNYFRVYNRWGQLMYEMKADRPGWDGMLKGVRQEMQTYVWVVEAVGLDGKLYNKKGTTVLIR